MFLAYKKLNTEYLGFIFKKLVYFEIIIIRIELLKLLVCK